MTRIVSPSLQEAGNELSEDVRSLTRFIEGALPTECDFYLRPSLNGLNPDLVLLHPNRGLAVIDVRRPRNLNLREMHDRQNLMREILSCIVHA